MFLVVVSSQLRYLRTRLKNLLNDQNYHKRNFMAEWCWDKYETPLMLSGANTERFLSINQSNTTIWQTPT